jgi:hypothetical protein
VRRQVLTKRLSHINESLQRKVRAALRAAACSPPLRRALSA